MQNKLPQLLTPRAETIIFVIIFAVCAATRLTGLGDRAIMHDESLFVWYTRYQLYENFDYTYLPILHGPAMLWIQAVVFHVFGVTDYTMRLGVALLGIGGLFWIRALRPWLGQAGWLAAAAFYTLSPSIMFYQRFFRNDALFLFTTLWIVASVAWWWRTRSPGWLASLVLSVTVLFCNKESSVFIYFTLGTFLLLVLLHDLAGAVSSSAPALEDKEPEVRVPAPAVALLLFIVPVLLLTRVFEGITYEQAVIDVIGRDFALSDVRSIPLALGWQPGGDGPLHHPVFWRVFYVLLAAAAVVLAYLLKLIVEQGIGHRALATRLWTSLAGQRWILLGSIAAGLLLYLILFTTLFRNPMGPFEIYQETLAYWMGQNAKHRIYGPFHMHLLNMAIYETGAVILATAGALIAIIRMRWSRLRALSLFLIALPLLLLHAVVFAGLDGAPPYFLMIGVWSVLLGGFLLYAPGAGRLVAPFGVVALCIYSLMFFSSASWVAFLSSGVAESVKGTTLTGRQYLDDTLSLTSGAHLWMIAILIVVATVLSWREIDRGNKFAALSIWWLITVAGACSYAREKVPWVGTYIALPLTIVAGIVVQRAVDRVANIGRSRLRRAAWISGSAVLILFLLFQAKSAFTLCFVNYNDVRERMVYGHSTPEVKAHADLIQNTARFGSLRTGSGATWLGEWQSNYNSDAMQRDVRVYVGNDELVWPMRWYLRHVDWDESLGVDRGISTEYDFLFLDSDARARYPELKEHYHLYEGRVRMHWTPQPLDREALLDVWRLLVPRHYRMPETPAGRLAEAAAEEWGKVSDYLLYRRIPGEEPRGLSAPMYLFGIRKSPLPGAAGPRGEVLLLEERTDVDEPAVDG